MWKFTDLESFVLNAVKQIKDLSCNFPASFIILYASLGSVIISDGVEIVQGSPEIHSSQEGGILVGIGTDKNRPVVCMGHIPVVIQFGKDCYRPEIVGILYFVMRVGAVGDFIYDESSLFEGFQGTG